MERYVVRHEFFGGLVYDRQEDVNILVDEDFFVALAALKDLPREQIAEITGTEDFNFFTQEGFLKQGTPNYRLLDYPHQDEQLSAPGRVHFYYTSACNLNCAHCFTKGASAGQELSFEEKLSMLDQMYTLGVNEILIGGGEPFTQSDFPDFVEACLERNIVTKVFTNGLLLGTPHLIERMSGWNLKYLSISIDGADEETYEKVRGVKGLSVIRKNLQMLKRHCSFTVAASITINPYNYDSAEDVLALIEDFGFDRLKVRPVKPGGNVMRNHEVFLTATQYVSFIREAQRIWNEQYNGNFTLDFSWGDTRLVYDAEKNAIVPLDIVYPYEGYGCFAGKVNIVFDAAGNALTCGFLPENISTSPVDNLREKSLKEIWESGKCFLALRDLPGNPACIRCDYYSICRGGCMARNLFFKKDINQPDPWCIKKYFPIKL